MAKNDGGRAFARTASEWNKEQSGMSVRAWYAGLAMQSIITSESYTAIKSPGLIAELAFVVDDAMIAEGEK